MQRTSQNCPARHMPFWTGFGPETRLPPTLIVGTSVGSADDTATIVKISETRSKFCRYRVVSHDAVPLARRPADRACTPVGYRQRPGILSHLRSLTGNDEPEILRPQRLLHLPTISLGHTVFGRPRDDVHEPMLAHSEWASGKPEPTIYWRIVSLNVPKPTIPA